MIKVSKRWGNTAVVKIDPTPPKLCPINAILRFRHVRVLSGCRLLLIALLEDKSSRKAS